MLRDFERRMMDYLLDGDDPTLEILRRQFANATVTQRENTGVGTFVHFSVPAEIERIVDIRNFHISDVSAEIESIGSGVSIVLFVRDGVLDFLEAVANGDEPWPDDVQVTGLSYLREKTPGSGECEESDTRDLTLMRKWAFGRPGANGSSSSASAKG